MKDILECYKTLGIEPGAAPGRVRIAYLQLSRFYDPARFSGRDAEHLAKAEQKRIEVEEAYQGIRHFLPALQSPTDPREPTGIQNRDFSEMVHKGPLDVSHAVVAGVLGSVVLIILLAAYFVFQRTRAISKAPASMIDQETVSSPIPTAAPSAAHVRDSR